MKLLRNFIIATAALMLLVVACKGSRLDIDIPTPVPPQVELVEVLFDDGSQSKTFSFMEYERFFDVAINDKKFGDVLYPIIPDEQKPWASVEHLGDGVFRIHLLENEGSKEHVTTITFRNANLFKNELTLTATQVGAQMKGSLRQGLVALFDATQEGYADWVDEHGWDVTDNWKSTKPLTTWYGVKPAGRTIKNTSGEPVYYGTDDLWDIQLIRNRLRGKIPEDFWNICHSFRQIDFSFNAINGSARGAGAELDEKWRSLWDFRGSVIPDSIWHEKLERINFQFTGITVNLNASIANAPNLVEMNFAECEVNGPIPSEITRLTKLQFLSLEASGLTGTIPDGIDNLQSLKVLYLNMNFGLGGDFPDAFYRMPNLRELYVCDSGISGSLKPEIKNMKSLEQLAVRSTHMGGEIPEEIGLIPGLTSRMGCAYFQEAHFTNLPEYLRFRRSGYLDSEWEPNPHGSTFIDRRQYREGVYHTADKMSIQPFENPDLITLPMPKWYKARWGVAYWTVEHEKWDHEDRGIDYENRPEFQAYYPYANDLQYPANEYFFDEKLGAWTHPAYEGKAAKHYHPVKGKWVYDEEFDWMSPAHDRVDDYYLE